MTLQEIYTKYTIPPNLVRHQIEVAAVGKYVCDHWTGPEVDTDLIVRTLLLHDLGNIIKFFRPFMGELEPQATYWEGIQADFIVRYGSSPDEATYKILEELQFMKILENLQHMKMVWEKPNEEASWEARICEFADTCVTPIGIQGFETRMQDLANRYGHTQDTSVYQAMKHNADLVLENVDTDLADLSKIDWSEVTRKVSGEGFDPSTATL